MSAQHTALCSKKWARARRMVFQRDNFHCVKCGKPGRLECDHILPLRDEQEQNPFNISGLQTLCRGCHIEKTAQENTRKFYQTPQTKAWKQFVDEI